MPAIVFISEIICREENRLARELALWNISSAPAEAAVSEARSTQCAVMRLVIVVHPSRSIVWTFLIHLLAKVTGNRIKYDKAEEKGEGV